MIDLIRGEAIQELAKLPDESVHLIATDLPYGTTACAWYGLPGSDGWKRIEPKNEVER